MKKIMITCAFIAIASVASFAQSARNTTNAAPSTAAPAHTNVGQVSVAERVAEQRAKVYQKNLGLDATQYNKIYIAELTYAEQEERAKAAGYTLGGGQLKQLNMAKDDRFKEALSAAQYSKYQAEKPSSTR